MPELGQMVYGNEWAAFAIPEDIEDLVKEGLIALSSGIDKSDYYSGYGKDFENDTFSMRRYWWGDEDAPEASLPNFHHKGSGLEIRWYKYIGRGMSSNKELAADEFVHVLADCMESLK
jgi:hypothetical protein